MKENLLNKAFLLYCVLIATGITTRIMHWPSGKYLLGAGIIISVVLIVMALIEIISLKTISIAEKAMWFVGFLVLSFLAILLYFGFRRRQLLRQKKILL